MQKACLEHRNYIGDPANFNQAINNLRELSCWGRPQLLPVHSPLPEYGQYEGLRKDFFCEKQACTS